jgi:hypothetical protein
MHIPMSGKNVRANAVDDHQNINQHQISAPLFLSNTEKQEAASTWFAGLSSKSW